MTKIFKILIVITFIIWCSIFLNNTVLANSYSIDFEYSGSEYASIDDSSQSGLALSDDFTIELWVNFESLPSVTVDAYSLVSKFDTTSNDRSYNIFVNSSNNLVVYITEDGTSDSGSRTQTITDSSIVTSEELGEWIHLAISYDLSSNTIVIYKNGNTVNHTYSYQAATSIYNSGASFEVSGSNEGTVDYFDGKIDELRIWSDIRTSQEINDNMEIELLGNESNLVTYYKFENNYLDFTINDNDLTAYNSPAFSTSTPFDNNEEEETSTTTILNSKMPILNDISVITGYTEHYENSTNTPDWIEKHYYHIPFIVWLFFWLIISFILHKFISILFQKYGN